jgi:hypothetical protein
MAAMVLAINLAVFWATELLRCLIPKMAFAPVMDLYRVNGEVIIKVIW